MSKELQSYIGTKKIVIEAGHIQAAIEPGVEQKQGVGVALGLLANISNPIHKTLLVDDRKSLVKSRDLHSYIRWLSDLGYKPDTVFLESELFKPSMELYQELRDRYPHDFLTHMPSRGRIYRGEGIKTSVGLTSLLTQSGQPSVELMDAALYLEKERLGDASLTVLPEKYRGEQKKTMGILGKAKRNVSAAQVFFREGSERILFKANA